MISLIGDGNDGHDEGNNGSGGAFDELMNRIRKVAPELDGEGDLTEDVM